MHPAHNKGTRAPLKCAGSDTLKLNHTCAYVHAVYIMRSKECKLYEAKGASARTVKATAFSCCDGRRPDTALLAEW